jgi:cation-transporting ATPase 13A1
MWLQERGLLAQSKHRYPFSSALKRMSVIVEVSKLDAAGAVLDQGAFVFTKGAPEVLEQLLLSTPPNYRAVITS